MDNKRVISLLMDWAPAWRENGPFDTVVGDDTFTRKWTKIIYIQAEDLKEGVIPEGLQDYMDSFPLLVSGYVDQVIEGLDAQCYNELGLEFAGLVNFQNAPYIRQDLVDAFNAYDRERVAKLKPPMASGFPIVMPEPVNLRVLVSEMDSFGPVAFTVETNYGWWTL